jgi:mono/diheme cytochrome c family protein
MKFVQLLLLLLALGAGAVAAVIYSGVVNVAADEPHGDIVFWLLEQTRENAIARAAKDIEVPNLEDPQLLLTGGSDYQSMCASCHLAPGLTESDMSVGLYPAPPNLSIAHEAHGHEEKGHEEKGHKESSQIPANNFWVIKHGIKASGMPAWGKTHDDKRIWAMVAFIEKLPSLTPDQYQILTAPE